MMRHEVILTRWVPLNKGLPLLLTSLQEAVGPSADLLFTAKRVIVPLQAWSMWVALKLVGNMCVYM